MQTETPLLTIAIPTFSRPKELCQCLKFLRAQSNHEFHLLILDNNSPVPAESAIDVLLSDFPALSTRVIRHSVNIGGDANILRCFELCESEYLWILGDDDEPLPDAVETIYKAIHKHPKSIFLNFWQGKLNASRATTANTIDELVSSIDLFSNLLFISTDIFRRDRLAPYLRYGYHYSYSMAAHLVVVLFALREGCGSCTLLDESIVAWNWAETGTQWSALRQMLAMGILLDLPLSDTERKKFAMVLPRGRVLDFLIIQLLVYIEDTGNFDAAVYIMEQVKGRLLSHSMNALSRFKFFLYRHIFLLFPKLSLRLFRYIIKRKNSGWEMLSSRDPFA